MASSVSTLDRQLSLDVSLEYVGLPLGRRLGVEWVDDICGGCSDVGDRGFEVELIRFLWRPGEAEAVLLCLCGGWNRSEESPGLDLARDTELADQVELSGLDVDFWFFWLYASAACI